MFLFSVPIEVGNSDRRTLTPLFCSEKDFVRGIARRLVVVAPNAASGLQLCAEYSCSSTLPRYVAMYRIEAPLLSTWMAVRWWGVWSGGLSRLVAPVVEVVVVWC